MLPGVRGRTARDGAVRRGLAFLLAMLALVTAVGADVRAQPVPPGLRPNPAPPGADRPPNFIAIPLAPAAPSSTPALAPAPRPPPSRPRAEAAAPNPSPAAPGPAADAPAIGLPIQRAVIHYLGAADAAGAQRAAGQLRRLADTIELRVVSDVPARPSIRYFHEEDAGAARVAAIALEGSGRFQVRGFPDYRPRPRPGLVEIWLPAP